MSETESYIGPTEQVPDMPPVLVAEPESYKQSEAPQPGRIRKALQVLHRKILAPILGR